MTGFNEPLLFNPIYQETLWGGSALAQRFKRPVDPQRTIGESWELVSHGQEQSIVQHGPFAGVTLANLTKHGGASLLGPVDLPAKFPLLCKFIDAEKRLSVQVHPSDLQARDNGWGEFGKTECWYIADARENAQVIIGFNHTVTRELIAHAIETMTLHEHLTYIPVKRGDVLYIPAGTVHAIMEGTFIYEVQETSTTTLRLYDWGRVDEEGNPRKLHVKDALSVLDTENHEGFKIAPLDFEESGYIHSFRVACSYFAVEEYLCTRSAEILFPARQSFRIVSVLAGDARLSFPHSTTDVPAGKTVLLPAALKNIRAYGSAGTVLLVTSVPDLLSEIIAPLRSAGVADSAIQRLGGCAGHNDLAKYLQV